jgi:hypothetical protein
VDETIHRDQMERQGIRSDYSKAVERLIESQSWRAMPGPEDQLPSDWMPRAFFDYLLRG